MRVDHAKTVVFVWWCMWIGVQLWVWCSHDNLDDYVMYMLSI